MDIPGRVENGVVVLEGSATLPEGSRVVVLYDGTPRLTKATIQRPVALPIFEYDGPPDVDLTNERIAEILDHDDASA